MRFAWWTAFGKPMDKITQRTNVHYNVAQQPVIAYTSDTCRQGDAGRMHPGISTRRRRPGSSAVRDRLPLFGLKKHFASIVRKKKNHALLSTVIRQICSVLRHSSFSFHYYFCLSLCCLKISAEDFCNTPPPNCNFSHGPQGTV